MKKHFALAVLLAAAPFAASAGELSYTFVEGGYAKVKINDDFTGDPEADGGYVRGSFAVSPQVFLFGGVGQVSKGYGFDGVDVDIDVTQSEFGIGYHQAMGERVEFTADIAYLREELNLEVNRSESFNDDAKGGRVSVGLRGQMSERAEAWLKAGYVDGGDFDGAFAGTLGGQFKFNATWGLVGEVEVIEDSTRYLAGVRASF